MNLGTRKNVCMPGTVEWKNDQMWREVCIHVMNGWYET